MSDREWMIPVGLLLAAQFAFCVVVAITTGFFQAPPFSKYAVTALSWVVLITGAYALWNLRHRPAQPARHLMALDWSRHRNFAFAMIFVWLQFVALTWGKAMLPVATSMWADNLLADADAALFGHDAWRLLPSQNAVIDAIYMAWLPTVGLAFSIFYFSKRPNRNAGLLAFFLTIGIMGTFGQYLLPSGGPIFFQRLGLGDRFADMPSAVHTHLISDQLWAAYRGRYVEYATGISAFPSVHVAVSSWIAIVFRNVFAIGYALLIFVGSIILGWHYALDGIAGAVGALICYVLAKAFIAQDWPCRIAGSSRSKMPA